MKPLVLAACLLMCACNLPFNFDFDFAQAVPEQSIPGSPVDAPLPEGIALPVRVDVGSKIVNPKSIGSITLGAMYLDVTSAGESDGDSDDWSFVERIDLYVESTKVGSTLPRLKVASAVAPGAVAHLELTPEDVNLLPYVMEGCQLSTEASGRTPADDVSYDGKVTFHVTTL